MDTIKVSIIVPVYGVENFIERCARSLFEQTMEEGIEFIFVNDCTKDKSVEILYNIIEKYPKRIPYIKILHHKSNKMAAGARNTGLDNACGEFVCMVDADDYLQTDMISILYKKAIDTQSDIVSSNSFLQYENKAVKYCIKKRNKKEDYLVDILDRTSSTAWWGRIYKRCLFEDNKIRINTDMTGAGEDYSTVSRVFYYAKKVELIEECLYNYVQYNPQAFTKNNLAIKQIYDIIKTSELVDDFFKDKEQIYKDAIEKGKVLGNLSHAFNFKDVELQKKGFNTFKNVNYQKFYPQLKWQYRITYVLAKNNLFRVLNLLTRVYKKIKLL